MIFATALLAAAAALQPHAILTLAPSHRIVEGIASDGTNIYLSSLLDRKILACVEGGSCRTFATLEAPLHPFGIAWDAHRKRLWVAADCPPGISAIKPCDRGTLIAFNAAGRISTRLAPATEGPFHPGDVSASPGGVFVSDSQNGAVFQVSGSGRSLATLVAAGIGKSGQGTALDGDGKTLLVADYGQGIAAIDIASGKRTLLPRQDGKPLRGIDGLTRCGNVFYGIYNGATPGTLVAITRTAAGIAFEQPLGDLEIPDPTQVALDGTRLLIVADSGWATLDSKEFTRTEGTPIWSVPLPEGCETR